MAYNKLSNLGDQPFAERELEAVKAGYAVLTCLAAIAPDAWVYVVRDEERKGKLARKTALPVYTLDGITVLMRQPLEDIRRLHELKAAFNGKLASTEAVEPRSEPAPAMMNTPRRLAPVTAARDTSLGGWWRSCRSLTHSRMTGAPATSARTR
jgi:hypothetical protein